MPWTWIVIVGLIATSVSLLPPGSFRPSAGETSGRGLSVLENAGLREAAASLAQGAGPAHGAHLSCTTGSSPTCGLPSPIPTGSNASGYWIDQSNDGPAPDVREAAAMVYDVSDGYVLLYGGGVVSNTWAYGALGETWTFSNGVWSQLLPANYPAPRLGVVMTYDAADGYVVLFGGWNAKLQFFSDTWSYHNDTWIDLAGKVSPSARWNEGLTYDARDGYVLLFGGEGAFTGKYLSDSWKFLDGNWTELSPTQHPSARLGPDMGYDPVDRYVLLYSGTPGNTSFNDTWNFQSGQWYNMTGSLSLEPIAQSSDPLIYDPSYGGMVLPESTNATGGIAFEFVAGQWARLPTYFPPPPGLIFRAGAYDFADRYLVLFGGGNFTPGSVPTNVTWALGASPVVVALVPVPVEVDVLQTVQFNVRLAPIDPSAGFSFAGLPPGCATANRSMVRCAPNSTGVYSLNATVRPSFGGSWTSPNLTFPVDVRPSLASFSAAPSPATEGRPVNFSATGVVGKGPLKFEYFGTPLGCPPVNRSWLECSPGAWGNFTVEVRVSDPRLGSTAVRLTLRIFEALDVGTLRVAPGNFADLGETVEFVASPVGGTPPVEFSYGGLPSSCTPSDQPNLTCRLTALGEYNVTFNASDTNGARSSSTVELHVAPLPALGELAVRPGVMDTGTPVTLSANLTGGSGPFVATWEGLPAGCHDSNSLSLVCSPSGGGQFNVSLVVTDSANYSADTSARLTVYPAPAVVSVQYPSEGWDIGRRFSLAVTATGGMGSLTYRFSAVGSPGACGLVTGPNFTVCDATQTGAFPFRASVVDGLGVSASSAGNVTIHPLPVISTWVALPASVSQGRPVDLSIGYSGGTPPILFRLSGNTTPCRFDAGSLVYACSPPSAGSFNFTLTLVDATGAEANASELVVVVGPSAGLSVAPELIVVSVGAAVAVGLATAWVVVRRRRIR